MSLSLTNPAPVAESSALPVRVVAAIALMLAAAVGAVVLKPTKLLAETKAHIKLEQQIPEAFGEWRLDNRVRPLVPDPSLQATINRFYSQTVSRTYVNAQGRRVMLSVAYGADQSSEATAVHRPEFCYATQGFSVADMGQNTLQVDGRHIIARHLVARKGDGMEPITYWVTLDERTTLPGFKRRMEQIYFGLRGEVADGMLFRLSSWENNPEQAYALHEQFVRDLEPHVPANVRARYFGS